MKMHVMRFQLGHLSRKVTIMAVDLRRDRAVEKDTKTSRQPDPEALDRVADQVRQDSREESERYLDETVVPHGGE
jgi:hypothetical protein